MHHGHGPGGPHGHEHSPHGHGHSPHGHGHSPHGHGHSPHGHGHSPHGHGHEHDHGHGHGKAFGHDKHDKHDKHDTHDKHKDNKKMPQVNPPFNPQPLAPTQHATMPQPQPIPVAEKDTGYSSQQAAGQPQQQNIPLEQKISYPQQQGGFPQQPAYAQQNFPPQQQKVPESAHEHPLNYANTVTGQCKICKQELGGQPGYNCGNCKILLCLQCADKIFYGQKKITIHPHLLALKDRNSWKCDLCKKTYKSVASFYFKQCDFDVCSACYISY